MPEDCLLKNERQKNEGSNKRCLQYARNHNIVERRIDDTVFLVNPKTDTILYLNRLGTAIWHLLAEPICIEEATITVQQAFPDVPPLKIADDVGKLFNQLSNKDFLIPFNCDAL